jgi:ABC-type antimicrobial peptide transport system permease subunit
MFHLGYVARELRRRLGRTVLTALGLGLGIGLVLGIIGVAQGLDAAQDDVLRPLESIGTDILVTRVAEASAPEGAGATAPRQPGVFFRGPNGALNQQDMQALLEENRNVVTDLASLGKPGERFTRDFFLSATLMSFPDQAVAAIAEVEGVTSAVGGLVQLAQHQTGTVPQIVASLQTGGQTVTQTVRPEPMTDAERHDFRHCLEDRGAIPAEPSGPPPGGGGGGAVVRPAPDQQAFEECLPGRFREFVARVTMPLQTIQQVVDPPSTDITNKSYTAAGVDPARPDVGLVTRGQLVKGEWFAKGATTEILLDVAYANANDLDVGSVVPINGKEYRVVGLVRPTLTGSTADVYFPLPVLQELSGKQGRVTQVLVSAQSSADVDEVAERIEAIMPGAEVVTTKALADQVTGSLADAGKLVDRLGAVLAVMVLAGAFAIAALLTLSSIAKRVREIGTLRAIGWSKRRVVGQLLGETLGIALLGGLLGLAAGWGASVAVSELSPTLSASTSGVPGIGSSSFAPLFKQASTATQTTDVALQAPLHPSTLLLGLLFALVGGVLAGLAGGWRAARLTPVVALRNLE